MNETQITREFRKELEKRFKSNLWLKKMVGGNFTEPGLPDLIGCLDGHFIAFEVKYIDKLPKKSGSKILKNKVTKDQLKQLELINQAGGYATGIIFIKMTHNHIVGILTEDPNNMTVNDLEYYFHDIVVIEKINGIWVEPFKPLYKAILKNLSSSIADAY